MKVVEFVQGFKDKKIMNTQIAPNAVEEYIKKVLEVKEYISFEKKRELCEKVLNACNITDKDNGLVKVDSVSRYILFTITLLSTYTNLEFYSDEDGMDSLDGYDMLCQNGLLNPILDVIGSEYISCNNILNMMMSDIVANHNSVENVLGHTTKQLLEMVEILVNTLSTKVESLDINLSQIDIDKYKGLIEQFTQK